MRIASSGLTLFGLALIGVASRPAKTPLNPVDQLSAASPKSGSATSENENGRAAGVLCRHFDQDVDCSLTSFRDKKIRTLIATIPDPHRTDLQLHFDRSLDSLLWAVADSGYSFERRWLPWAPGPGEEPSPISGAEKNPTVSRANGDRKLKDEPGLLLFRGETWNDVLLLFLIGETVTGGLDRPMFRRALHYMDDLGSDNNVWIVGPSFSGSFDSLAKMIQDAGTKSFFHIISGTATHRESQQKFSNVLSSEIHDKRVTFSSTVENDALAVHAFIDYLWQRWGDPGEIALLAEDQTAYGGVAEELPHVERERHEQWLFLRFPYGISRLRNSYEQQNAAATLTNDKSLTPKVSTPQNLPFNIGTPDEIDIVPTFSKVQSPISQEATLLSVASSLQRERVGYVGIVATDVLDAVFLTRFLRKTCPDVRIFMFDSDLLFARAELNTALEGILNITTYPLFGRNQHWTRTELQGVRPRRTAFADRYAEGEYNAARKQLWDMHAIVNPNAQRSEILLDYKRPDMLYQDERRPPLWLTVLGRDGYWPVALLDKVFRLDPEDAETSSLEPAPFYHAHKEELHPEPPSHAWILILASIAAFGLFHSSYIWFVYLFPKPPQAISKRFGGICNAISMGLYRFFAGYPRATAASPQAPARDSEALRCSRLLLWVTLVLLCAQMVVAASGIPYVFRMGDKDPVDYLYFGGPLCSLVVLLVTACSISLLPGFNRKLGWAAWVGSLIFLGLWWWPFLGYHQAEQQVFFFTYRMSHPGNGVSPAIPVLLLLGALFAWGFMLLARRAGVPPPEVPGLGDPPKLAAILDCGLAKVAPGRSLILALSMVLAWGFLFRGLIRLRSVEGRSYDVLILLLLAVTYGLLFAAWSQLLDAWSSFRRFLEALERHPMHKAFSRMPKELSALPLFQAEPQKVDLFTSARFSHTADALLSNIDQTAFARLIGARAAAIRYWMRCSELQLANRLREHPHAYGQVSAVSHQLEQTVLSTANDLIAWSQDEFWHDGDSASLPEESGTGDREQRQRILAEEFIALRFVMYIRHVLRQMRSLLWFIVIDFVLTVLALSSYPFQSGRLVTVLCVGTLLILGSGIGLIFAQMDRDAVLSSLSASQPNEIGKSFYMRLASFGALPLLAVLATRFPSIGEFLSGWVQPALEALR